MGFTERSLRVGLVVPAFDKGGLESVVYSLYRGIKAAGHSATVLVEGSDTGYCSGRLDPGDLAVLRGSREQFFAEVAARRLNVLHYHYSTLLLPEMKRLGLGVLYTLHNVYTWMGAEAFRERATVLASADQVVAVSSYVKDYFLGRSGMGGSRITVVPNGVELEALRSAPRARRADFGLPEDAFVFGQFAFFHRVKHHAVLVRAAEQLARRHKDFRVVFFGGAGDPAYLEEIRQRVGSSKASAYLHLAGPIPEEEVPGVLRGVVDCALLTTLQEGCGNAALEAAALGKPVIMTDTGIARDLAASGADIDIVPAALGVEKLTSERIQELSRDGDTDNLPAIVEAMARRMGKRTAGPSPGFRFTLEDMRLEYNRMYQAVARIA